MSANGLSVVLTRLARDPIDRTTQQEIGEQVKNEADSVNCSLPIGRVQTSRLQCPDPLLSPMLHAFK